MMCLGPSPAGLKRFDGRVAVAVAVEVGESLVYTGPRIGIFQSRSDKKATS